MTGVQTCALPICLFKVKLIQCLSCEKKTTQDRKLGETGGLNSGIICFALWPACMHMMND